MSSARQIASEALAVLARRNGQGLARRDLARLCGCTERELRQAVSLLREDGHLVLADQGRYRLARDRDEVLAYTSVLRQQVQATVEVIQSLEQAAEALSG